jgi:hypothetical protein
MLRLRVGARSDEGWRRDDGGSSDEGCRAAKEVGRLRLPYPSITMDSLIF